MTNVVINPINQLTIITEPGPYTYSIPSWATVVDVVLVGEGAGGYFPLSDTYGVGGGAGSWAAGRLVVDGQTEITGTVAKGNLYEYAPTATTATATDWDGLSASGGVVTTNGTNTESASYGASPGDETYNNNTYPGGDQQTVLGADGISPGGGGAGSTSNDSPGGSGADGAAFFWARA